MNKDLTILLMAYDSYNDVWPGFVKCKKKYWKDCPYEMIMINCDVPLEKLNKNVQTGVDRVICAGKKTEWTERLHKALEEIDTPFVLLWLEDLFLDKKLDTSRIISYIELMNKNTDIGHIRICKDAEYQLEYDEDNTLGELLPNHAYRICTQPALWRKDYLYELTKEPMDAWNFEYQMGFKCDDYNMRCFITKDDLFHFTNMVWRGKWTKEAVALDKKEHLDIDYNHRKKHSIWSNLKTNINSLIYIVLGPDLVTKIVMKRRKMGKGIPKG